MPALTTLALVAAGLGLAKGVGDKIDAAQSDQKDAMKQQADQEAALEKQQSDKVVAEQKQSQDTAMMGAKARQQSLATKMPGMQSTILTSPLGETGAPSNTASKTLLGG